MELFDEWWVGNKAQNTASSNAERTPEVFRVQEKSHPAQQREHSTEPEKAQQREHSLSREIGANTTVRRKYVTREASTREASTSDEEENLRSAANYTSRLSAANDTTSLG